MRSFLFTFAALFSLTLLAAEKPVPVRDEPMHRVVFENDTVRLIDVQIKPGETSLYHIHVIPSVVVYLTQSTNRSESWPDKTILTRDVAPGQSRYAPYDEKPLTHRVTNTGAGLFRVFDIELLNTPGANRTLPPIAGSAMKSQWEEKLARSSELQLEPKAKTEISAGGSSLLVVAVNGTLQLSGGAAGDGKSKTLKWGDYQFFPPNTRLVVTN